MTKHTKGKSKPVRKISKPGKATHVSYNGLSQWHKWSPWIFLGIAGIIFLQARIQLLAIPLERDEGSFAYISHWLLRGKDLYTDMLDSKLPGLYTLYAISTTLFGYNATGVHLGLLFTNIAAGIFFFLLLREVFNQYIASISTAFLLILITAPNVNGFAAHATQLLLPFLFAGCWLFWKGIRTGNLLTFFLAGLMIGISFTIKQQTALFGILLAFFWWPLRLSWHRNTASKLPIMEWILLGAGGLIPVILTVAYFKMAGRFDEFVFWTYTQPIKLSGSMADPWYVLLWRGIVGVNAKFELVWITAFAGLILTFFSGFKTGVKWFAILFTIFCIASIALGVAFYKHYFVVVMPAVAMCTGIALYWISQKTGKAGGIIGIAAAVVLISVPLIARQEYYFKPDFAKIHQEAYRQNMFPELEKIGQELSKRIPEGGKLAILGSEPEVLVAANREGCSKHLMVYSMLIDPEHAQAMQDDYYTEITQCDADYVVFDVFSSSWAPGFENLGLHKKNMEWINSTTVLEGIAEYREGLPGIILWGDEARNYKPQSTYLVYVLKKK